MSAPCGSCDGAGVVRYASGDTEPCPFCGPVLEDDGGPAVDPAPDSDPLDARTGGAS